MLWGLKKLYYRLFQKALKLVVIILRLRVPVIVTGPGSVRRLAENIKARGIKNVLIVTDKVLMDLKLLDSLLISLDEKGIKYSIFGDVMPNPTIENIEAGKRIYNENKCKGLIAFGGGSPIDCAKVIGARVRNPYMPVRFMKGLLKVIIPIPPFYCIPTTAGTGSEVTVGAVITDTHTHEKFLINDPKLIPEIAVLDPELMVGLPKVMTSTTGIDALTHAVEAYISVIGNSYTEECAEHAVKLIFENLESVYENGNDIQARENMSIAAFYACVAVTRAGLGYVHAISHNLGGLYGVPHGLANSVILPHVLELFSNDAGKKLASLAIAAGIGNYGEPDEELSKRFIEKIKEMNRNMDIPTCIKELKEDDINRIVEGALKEANLMYAVPRIIDYDECFELVKKLLPPSYSAVY